MYSEFLTRLLRANICPTRFPSVTWILATSGHLKPNFSVSVWLEVIWWFHVQNSRTLVEIQIRFECQDILMKDSGLECTWSSRLTCTYYFYVASLLSWVESRPKISLDITQEHKHGIIRKHVRANCEVLSRQRPLRVLPTSFPLTAYKNNLKRH